MTRVLLDTHALIWLLIEPARLSQRSRALLAELDTTVFVSPVSAYEIGRKNHLGKLGTASVVAEGFGGHLRRIGAEDLELSSIHAFLAARLPSAHRDPFDRLLAAQSLAEDIPVVTQDRAIAELGAATIW